MLESTEKKFDLARDPTAGTATHRPDNRFIPVRADTLVQALAAGAQLPAEQRLRLRRFTHALIARLDREASEFEWALAEMYQSFNPDRDTIPEPRDTAARSPAGYADLSRRISYLLDKANFERLEPVGVEQAMRLARVRGMTVRLRPDRVEELSIWVRGHAFRRDRLRTWRHPWRGEPVEVAVYQRLVVVARLRDDPHVLIKAFKDIPECDIEALLPHAEVRMTWFDRVKVVSGGAGVLGTTATKVAPLITTVSSIFLVLSQAMWVLLFGAGLLTWRTVHGYRNARLHRDSQRTRNLYFQNMANNAGALHLLTSMIAQEEIKEAALAYVTCLVSGSRPTGEDEAGPIRDSDELRRRVEHVLRREFDVEVEFDVNDAISTISRLSLWRDRDGFRVLPVEEATAALEKSPGDAERRAAHEHLARGTG